MERRNYRYYWVIPSIAIVIVPVLVGLLVLGDVSSFVIQPNTRVAVKSILQQKLSSQQPNILYPKYQLSWSDHQHQQPVLAIRTNRQPIRQLQLNMIPPDGTNFISDSM